MVTVFDSSKPKRVYVYCYNCKKVLGEPEYLLSEIKKEIKDSHMEHFLTDSDLKQDEDKQLLEQGK